MKKWAPRRVYGRLKSLPKCLYCGAPISPQREPTYSGDIWTYRLGPNWGCLRHRDIGAWWNNVAWYQITSVLSQHSRYDGGDTPLNRPLKFQGEWTYKLPSAVQRVVILAGYLTYQANRKRRRHRKQAA